LDLYVTLFSGVCMANWAVTLSRLVLNQMSRDRVVGIGGGGGLTVAFSNSSRAFQSERAQLGEAGGGSEERGLEAKENGNVVGASGGEGV